MHLFSLPHDTIHHLVATYGYLAVALAIGIESFGVPFPGETVFFAAAIYAGNTHRLNIWLVLASAAGGASLGGLIGYVLGEYLGYWLLIRYGRYVWLTEPRIKVGQYLFLHYGEKVVFFGRFFPLLREIATFLAGANRMPFAPFMIANVSGAVVWASVYGLGAYMAGRAAHLVAKPVAIGFAVLTVLIVIGLIIFFKRNEARLEKLAEEELPGPLQPMPRRKPH